MRPVQAGMIAAVVVLAVTVAVLASLAAAATYEMVTAPLPWWSPDKVPAPVVTRALSIHMPKSTEREPDMQAVHHVLAGAGLPALEPFPATSDAKPTGSLSAGQVGCTMSHIRALREVGNPDAPPHHWAFIFEDDAVPTLDDIGAHVKEALTVAPPSAPVVMLGFVLETRKQVRLSTHVWAGRAGVTTHAYAVRVAAANVLADNIERLAHLIGTDGCTRYLLPNAVHVYARPDRRLTDLDESTSRGLFKQAHHKSAISDELVDIRSWVARLNVDRRASWFLDMLTGWMDHQLQSSIPHA
jgi:GR25 family glycosyltransferase involved in LPS biosynthesis